MPVDVAAVIIEVTGVDEVAIGRALVRNTRPCHTRFVSPSGKEVARAHFILNIPQAVNSKQSKLRCGENTPDIGTRAPRTVPADADAAAAAAIIEGTGENEVAIGRARFSP